MKWVQYVQLIFLCTRKVLLRVQRQIELGDMITIFAAYFHKCNLHNKKSTNTVNVFYLVNTRMRSKWDIKTGRLCTRRGEGRTVLGIVGGGGGGGVTFPFFKWWRYSWRKHAIFRTFIRSRGSLENPTRFQTIMVKILSAFWKNA